MVDFWGKRVAWLRSKTEIFNEVGRGGPRRLVVIVCVAGLMVVTAVVVSMMSYEAGTESVVAKMPKINPLPGGPNGDAAQDALLLRDSQEKAKAAAKKGESYTPPIPASVPLHDPALPGEVGAKAEAGHTESGEVTPEVTAVVAPPPAFVPPEKIEATIIPVNATSPAGREPAKPLDDAWYGQWEQRPPRTDVVLAPAADVLGGDDEGRAPRTEQELHRIRALSAPAAGAPSIGSLKSGESVLVPAGRYIFAHTVVAVDSDSGGPIVLEADSGPLAGDRMIGSFSKNGGERLVVRVSTVEHHGQALDVRGLVIAPDSMETVVASSVDEHYLERFVYPAAVAFVAGLGQAVALSNSTTAITPFGGTVTSIGPLNFKKEAEIAGGAAAAQVGQTLQQDVPKGPTVKLAANVSVGVMFLSNVVGMK